MNPQEVNNKNLITLTPIKKKSKEEQISQFLSEFKETKKKKH